MHQPAEVNALPIYSQQQPQSKSQNASKMQNYKPKPSYNQRGGGGGERDSSSSGQSKRNDDTFSDLVQKNIISNQS